MPESFDLNVVQMKYLVGALGGGLVLLTALVLAYLAMWQPRRTNADGTFPPPQRSWRAAWAYFPWVVALTIAASVIYGVAMAVAYAIHPPNW